MSVDLSLPIYTQWPKIPSGLATKTQLAKDRLALPEMACPVAYKKSTQPVRYYALYSRFDAVPMPPKLERKPRDYSVQFERTYPTRRAAYGQACEALFNLNRYAKHSGCTPKHREAIYALKNAWIKKLYQEGFCVEAVQAKTPAYEGMCFACEGGGNDDFGDECWKCDGTGIYRSGGREYWAFRFVVDGSSYAWHQPTTLLSFVPQSMGEQHEHEVVHEEKPVALSPRKFAEAKSLIGWCLEEETSKP